MKSIKEGDVLILTRMGDGAFVEMSEAEIRKEIETGVAEGAKKAKCPPLTDDDIEKLMAIICDPRKFRR